MRRITVTASTIGQQNPSQVSLSGGYRYRGDKKWPADRSAWEDAPTPGIVPADPRCSSDRKRERMDRFAAALAEQGYTPQNATGKAVVVAAGRAGVSYETARGYRKELRERSLCGGKVQGHDWQPDPGDPEAADQDGMRCHGCGITEAEACRA